MEDNDGLITWWKRGVDTQVMNNVDLLLTRTNKYKSFKYKETESRRVLYAVLTIPRNGEITIDHCDWLVK